MNYSDLCPYLYSIHKCMHMVRVNELITYFNFLFLLTINVNVTVSIKAVNFKNIKFTLKPGLYLSTFSLYPRNLTQFYSNSA